ncbi:MAG: succinate dehydrogenase assembly factor 2 [Burkholderiaceae bacterium]|nr:succinate dehydrogenase assembly factor 2 [Burkholderiaceae bacterium]
MALMQPDPFAVVSPAAGSADLAPEEVVRRLRWRARRGLLENDLLLERFFQRWGSRMTLADHDGLGRLLDLTDNDLLDLLVGRIQPEGDLDSPEVRSILEKIRANQP